MTSTASVVYAGSPVPGDCSLGETRPLIGEMGMLSPQLQGVRPKRAAIGPPFEISGGIHE
jgi:hypothetical protein